MSLKMIEAMEDQRHKIHMETSEQYRKGYAAGLNMNPHVFPIDLETRRMAIAWADRPLTPDEKVQLKNLNEEFDATDWAQWSLGHYRRITELSRRN